MICITETLHNKMYGNHTRRASTATMKILLLLLSGSLAGSAAAAAADPSKRHVQLVTPTPFAWVQYGPTNPLRPDGSDYPCKVPAGDAFTLADGGAASPTEVVAGAAHAVRLAGWAVHGGGSCQFALAAGHAPARDARWRVIRSIEGGCPRANATGNLAPGEEPDAYTFVVPEDFAPGNYTWAWTWVNRIGGSPEFYMNCAPITVKAPTGSGSSGRRATTEQRRQVGGGEGGQRRRRQRTREAATADGGSTAYYPDLFLANIGSASNGCNTSEALYQQVAIAYPHPGNSVSRPNGPGESLYEQPCDGNPRNNNNGATSTLSSSSLASSIATLPAAATPTPSEPASSSRVPTTSPSSSSSALSTPASSVMPSSTVTFSSSSSAAAPTRTSTSTTTTLDSPCTDGHLLCMGGTQFSTCTGGAWDAPQDLAADTTCEEEGESVGLDTTYHWA